MYNYERERPALFTDEGQRRFVKVQKAVNAALSKAGAFRFSELRNFGEFGSSWEDMACLDRLVELGEIVKLRGEGECWAQYQVYASPQVHNL